MENWENNILANKLNSLQEFPDGYTPDLSSKWEIVEAGLPLQKKHRIVPLIIRWSVAAAVLLAIAFVWMNNAKTAKPDIAQSQKSQYQPQLPLAINDSSENKTMLTVKQSLPKKELPEVARKNITLSKKIAQQDTGKPALPTPAQENIALISTPIKQHDTATFHPGNELAVIAPAENSRPAKRKVYQRDFSDNVLVIDTGFSTNSNQHFGIRLFPFKNRNNSGEQPAVRLQLKQIL